MKIFSALFVVFLFAANVSKAQTDTIEMHLLGPHCIKVCKGATLYDSGYIIADSLRTSDLTITSEGTFNTVGTNEIGVYKLRYKAVDKNGNTGLTEWRTIQVVDSSELPGCQQVAISCDSVDTIPPVITLIGDRGKSVCRCASYKDPGYIVTDNIDSSNNIKIETDGTFLKDSTKIEGVYTLRYKATDRTGNFAYSDWRYIFIRNPFEAPCYGDPRFDPCTGKPISIKDDFKEKSKINIYPNPANEEIFIESDQMINTIGIYSISGQKLAEIFMNQTLQLPYKIDTKHFPAGVYMVQVKTPQGMVNKKVQISK